MEQLDTNLYYVEQSVTANITSMFNDLSSTEDAIAYEMDDGTYIPLEVGTSSGNTYLYHNTDSTGEPVDTSKPFAWCRIDNGTFYFTTNENRGGDTVKFRSGMPYIRVGGNVSDLFNDAGYLTSLTFDNVPTAGSDNPVKSGGVKAYVDAAVADVDPDLSSLAAVAFSGNYYDLDDRPDIPVVSRDIEADSANYGKAAAAKAVKEFVEGKGYLTQHQSLTDYATKVYVDAAVAAAGGAPELFPVTMDLNLSTMALTNPSATFAEAQAAIAAGKLPVVTLSYVGANGAETSNAFLTTARSDTLQFTVMLRANFGAGAHIYIFILLWTASAATLMPVTLPEKLSDLTNDQNFMTGNQVAATVRSEIEDRIIYGIDYAYILNKPTVDTAPTANSGNLVSSGGVKTYVDTAVAGGTAPSTVQAAFTIDATQDKQTITGVTGDLAGAFAKLTNGRRDLVRAELNESVSGAVLCLPLVSANLTQSEFHMVFSIVGSSAIGVGVFTLTEDSRADAPTDGSFYLTPQQMAEMGLPEVYLAFDLQFRILN